MKVVILAGGFSTRIREESGDRPKPMVEIGGKPILWHIMNIYKHYNHTDFIIALGYKGNLIKEYFTHYGIYNYDLQIARTNNMEPQIYTIDDDEIPFNLTLANTGEFTQTGGRLKKIQRFLDDKTFLVTYGDGVTDANINDVIKFHQKKGKLATMLAPSVPSGFGIVDMDKSGNVKDFAEKKHHNIHINGGYFVLEPKVFDYIKNDDTSWEFDCLTELVKDKELNAYKYEGFWKCMDSPKDKIELDKMWNENRAPWKIW